MKKSVKNAWAKRVAKKVAMVICPNCGKLARKDEEFIGADGKYYCEDCFDEIFVHCDKCNEVICRDDSCAVGNECYCEDCFDEDYVACYDCGKPVRRDESYVGADDEMYCEDCFYNTFEHCECCGEVMYRDDAITVHTSGRSYNDSPELWCEDCAVREAHHCEDCGDWFKYSSDGYETDDGWVCDQCADEDYVRCDDCGDYVRCENSYEGDDGNAYCGSCWDERKNRVINKYHSGVRPLNWHGSSEEARSYELNVGVELELCDGGTDADKAREIIESTGYEINESFVCERDGSLRNGFEIISSTATTEFHIREYGWDKIMETAQNLGYTSHDSGLAGLHVHLDRKYFDNMMENPEKVISIIVMNNAGWMKKFSRRRNFGYCEFPSAYTFEAKNFKPRMYGSYNEDKSQLERVCRHMHGHGACMNFDGYSTIEIRFNRGTLKFSTFVATMQFVQMLADFTKKSRIDRACNIRLRHFKALAKARHYDEFLNYLAERHIN